MMYLNPYVEDRFQGHAAALIPTRAQYKPRFQYGFTLDANETPPILTGVDSDGVWLDRKRSDGTHHEGSASCICHDR